MLSCPVGYCTLSCFLWKAVSSPGAALELAAFSTNSPPTTTAPAQQRTNSHLGTVKARSTLSPQVDTLAQRERLRGKYRGKPDLGHRQLPSGPCSPAVPGSTAVSVQSGVTSAVAEVTIGQREGQGRAGQPPVEARGWISWGEGASWGLGSGRGLQGTTRREEEIQKRGAEGMEWLSPLTFHL